MKNFFGKIKDLILKHKLLAIVCFLATLLAIILLVMVILMTLSTANTYGNRLEGIEDVKISQSTLKEKEDKLEEYEEISNATVRTQGKIVYFTIHYNHGTSKDKAKELANLTLENFTAEEKSFYELQYILIEDIADNDEEATNFVITGTKHNTKEAITWSKN